LKTNLTVSGRWLATGILLGWVLSSPLAADELIAVGTLPGTSRDHSGLKDPLAKDVPHDRLGGFSAIDYTGEGQRYCVLADRGPGDGAYPYSCRVHYLKVELPSVLPGQLKVSLLSTSLLHDVQGRPLLGASSAFDSSLPRSSRRFDPEGMRLGRNGELYISDEYGPSLLRFTASGTCDKTLPLPARFLIAHPSATKNGEAVTNQSGRQPNKGMEGLAIVPSGRKLVGALQGALIQDSVATAKGKRTGRNVRLVEFDLQTEKIREFLYPLDADKNGISEILAVNDEEFIVLERDGVGGLKAKFKKLVKVNLGHATDISKVDVLPANQLPDNIVPVQKSVLIDLLDSRHGLAGKSFPEKVEGLAFGPTLPDGRRLLIVCVDNDFLAEFSTSIYAFAIDQAHLPNYGWKH
jgi:hypothetical protein